MTKLDQAIAAVRAALPSDAMPVADPLALAVDRLLVAMEAECNALRAKLDVTKREILSASLFAAELAESIGPSDEWSHEFKEGYVFGGRDAARMIRQKCTFPDAALSRKATT